MLCLETPQVAANLVCPATTSPGSHMPPGTTHSEQLAPSQSRLSLGCHPSSLLLTSDKLYPDFAIQP